MLKFSSMLLAADSIQTPLFLNATNDHKTPSNPLTCPSN